MKGKKFFGLFVLLGALTVLCTAWCKRDELREWSHRAPVAPNSDTAQNPSQLNRIEEAVNGIRDTLNDEKGVTYETTFSGGVMSTKKVRPTSQPVVGTVAQETTPAPRPVASTQPAEPTTQAADDKETPASAGDVLPWYKHPYVLIPTIIIAAFLFRSVWRSRVGTKEERQTQTSTPAVGTKKEKVTTRSSTDWGKVVWRLAILGVLVWLFYTKWDSFVVWYRSSPSQGVVEIQKVWPVSADNDDYASIQCPWYNRKFSVNSSIPIEIIDPDGVRHTYDPSKGRLRVGSQVRSHGKWSFRSLVPGKVASIIFTCPVEN